MDAPIPKFPTLNIGREIGTGVYCMVYEGELNGNPVAIKKLKVCPTHLAERQQTLRDALWRAGLLLKHLSHPHIVKLFQMYESKEEGPVVVMERMQHSLEEHLVLYSGKLSHQRQIDFCLQIADAVHYLHSQQPPVVYCDLSPITVFVSRDGCTLKLGLAIRASSIMLSYGYSDVRPTGAAPEVLADHSRYTEKIDIFCFGMLMLEIATHHLHSLRSARIGETPVIDSCLQRLPYLPEDHPLKPIILQCLRDDPEERPDSGAVFRMLSEAHPILQAAYEEALNKHGSVSVDVISCIFVGPPAVGKSTLKHLLVHNTPKAVKTSTAVMAAPEVVTISSEHYIVGGSTSAWQLVNNGVMEKSLRACINTRAYDENQYPNQFQHQDSQHQQVEKREIEIPHPRTSLNPIQKFMSFLGRAFHASDTHHTVTRRHDSGESSQRALRDMSAREQSKEDCNNESSEIIAMLDTVHSKLMKEMQGGYESINLKDASFIHLLDTGGQPPFQDALPLLLDVPCTYIQVFNAARDLDQPIPITYRRDDHTEESLSPSAETGWELMLRSFSSMHTMAQKCSKELATFQQEGSQCPQLRIVLVGTFKDQLVEEGRHDRAVRDISRRLRGLKGKPYYKSITWDADCAFYLINSVEDKGDEKGHINCLRKHLSSEGSALKLKVPVMWYMCQQITQRVPLKFFRFNDLKEFCLKHQFIEANNADSQFRSLLKLFSLLCFYAFFDLKDVPDEANYVCTDRSLFLKEVSKLLAVQFAAARSPAMEILKETGIFVFTIELFQELDISREMDLHWFMNSLCHLGIAARLPTKERAEYFIPAVLPHRSVRQNPSCSIAPLCLTYKMKEGAVFTYSDLPQGIFCRLMVELIQQGWTVIENQNTRTLLKFRWKEFEIFLQEYPGYISLIPQIVEEFSSVSELHAGCKDLHDTVTLCLSRSAEAALGSHFSTVAELVVGFECPCQEVNLPHLALPSSTGKSRTCSETSSCQVYTKQQRIWFSTVDGATLKFLPHQKFWSLENSPCRQKLSDDTSAIILSQNVYDRPDYLMLFRKHVSRRAADKGSAVLEGVGLDAPTIQTCFMDHHQSVEEAVHAGLIKWSGGQGLPPTWEVLLQAMEYAEIGQQHIEGLKTALDP